MEYNEAVWQFLNGHRGRMFCARCIGEAVSAAKRIDNAIMRAEGRGAIRHHGLCATCRKNRLLCGLA